MFRLEEREDYWRLSSSKESSIEKVFVETLILAFALLCTISIIRALCKTKTVHYELVEEVKGSMTQIRLKYIVTCRRS